MRLVIIESPYAGDILMNTNYARRCMADSIHRKEAPLASHLLYTQPDILNDLDPEERRLGIALGLAWSRVAELHAFYIDRGWSRGMVGAYQFCKDNNQKWEFRSLERRELVGPPPSNEAPISGEVK